jgi:DNA modification methylase
MYTILQGDTRQKLKELPDNSVHCAVSSPPYFQLRDYGVGGQIGQETTVQEYIAALVEVFAEVHRVLRPDGTLWLNIGDSYAVSGNGGITAKQKTNRGSTLVPPRKAPPGFKPKDLMLIPHRLAIALQEWGWYLRSDIVWHKLSTMPESVTDRPSKAHEYIFLFTKSEDYFYDQDAIREPYSPDSLPRALRGVSPDNKWKDAVPGSTAHTISKPRANQRKEFTNGYGGGGSGFSGHSGYYSADGRLLLHPLGRNKRDVWQISSQPFNGRKLLADFTACTLTDEGDKLGYFEADRHCPYHADLANRAPGQKLPQATQPLDCTCQELKTDHYAVFPETLVEPCLLAGTSAGGCCNLCRTPYRRVYENLTDFALLGYKQACACDGSYPVPCVVLDPFAGAGTTLLVAEKLGRNSIGIELNPEYCRLIERRIEAYHAQTQPDLFSAVTAVLDFARNLEMR